jgi:hypothetical protein
VRDRTTYEGATAAARPLSQARPHWKAGQCVNARSSACLVGLPLDCHRADPIGAQQHNPRPSHMLLRTVPRSDHDLQPFAIAHPKPNFNALLIQPDPHIREPVGIIRQRRSIAQPVLCVVPGMPSKDVAAPSGSPGDSCRRSVSPLLERHAMENRCLNRWGCNSRIPRKSIKSLALPHPSHSRGTKIVSGSPAANSSRY